MTPLTRLAQSDTVPSQPRRLSMRHLIATASLAALGLGSSCINTDASVFVQGALPINPEEDCVVDANGDTFVAAGLLDLSNPHAFKAALKVVTNLPATFSNQDVSQGRTASPNYPNYGAVDNNVITFSESSTTFSFTVGNVASVRGDSFKCDEATGECFKEAETVSPVSGTVFNTQTQLNTEAVVFVEPINLSLANELKDSLANGAELDFPGKRISVVANVTLKGNTTGNAGIRDLSTQPFPLLVEVCNGCLIPDADFCKGKDSKLKKVADATACFPGQDVATGFCECDDGTPLDNKACE